MNRGDKLRLLQDVVDSKRETDTLQERVSALFGWSECEFTDTLYRIVDRLITTTEKCLGDEHQWITYFIYECECGKDPKLVKWKENEKDELTKEVNLSTVEQLLELIED